MSTDHSATVAPNPSSEHADRASLLGLPTRADAPGVILLTAAFAFVFLFFYGGASFLSGFVPYRIHVDFAWERLIPFLPCFSTVYLSMDLLVGLAPFVFRNWRAMLPMFMALSVQTLLAAACFMLLPVETNFPERVVVGTHASSFALADLMNLERNFLPSLHVAYAVTAALFFGERTGITGRLIFAFWALAIAASTMLIHEHHLLDVVAGGGLAFWAWRVIGPRFAEGRIQDDFEIEWLILKAYAAFTRRHLRYLLIALGLSRASLFAWRRRRVLRSGFCFLQIVDDLLDGDRKSEREPLAVVDDLVKLLESPDETAAAELPEDLVILARAFRADLVESAGKAALDEAIRLMRVMQTDRRRVRERRLLDGAELREQLRLTFHYSVNLMLAAAGGTQRAGDVPELIEVFGWCSTMRDLREDLDAGLINVPREVLARAGVAAGSAGGADPGSGLRYDDLIGKEAVREWMAGELIRARSLLDRCDERLAGAAGNEGRVLRMFARSIRSYADKKLPRRYPFLGQ